MKTSFRIAFLAVPLVAAFVFAPRAYAQNDVAAIVNSLPAANPNPVEGRKAVSQLLQTPNAVAQIVAMLTPPEKGGDARARFALHGMVSSVAHAGADDARRKAISQSLAAQLDGAHPIAIKRFLIQELQVCGGPEVGAKLGALANDSELGLDAIQALAAIGQKSPSDVKPILRGALPQAKGAHRAGIVSALGDLRDTASSSAIRAVVNDESIEVRHAALKALANIGDAASLELLKKAAVQPQRYEQGRVTDALLLLAQRIGQAGQTPQSAAVFREVLQTRMATTDSATRIAALHGLAALPNVNADAEVLAALGNDDIEVRMAAISAGVLMPGNDVATRWLKLAETATPRQKAGIIALLTRRGDAAVLPVALAALKENDAELRRAAVQAAGVFGGGEAVQALLPLLGGPDGRPALEALIRMPGRESTRAMGAALANAGSGAKPGLLNALALRGATGAAEFVPAIQVLFADTNPGIRGAAFNAFSTLSGPAGLPVLTQLVVKAPTPEARGEAEKALGSLSRLIFDDAARNTPLIAALNDAEAPAKAALLRVIGQGSGSAVLEVLKTNLSDTKGEVREAAVRALAKSSDAAALPLLKDLAQKAPEKNYQVLALGGYLRLASVIGNAEEKVNLIKEGLSLATRPEEKRQALAALGETATQNSFALVTSLLDNAEIAAEAALAAVAIAEKLPASEDNKAVMRKILEIAKDEKVRNRATAVINRK